MQEQQGTVDLIGQVTLFGNFSPLPNSFHNNKISSSDRYSDLQIHTAMDMSSKHVILACSNQAHAFLFSPSLTLSAVKIKTSSHPGHHSPTSTCSLPSMPIYCPCFPR